MNHKSSKYWNFAKFVKILKIFQVLVLFLFISKILQPESKLQIQTFKILIVQEIFGLSHNGAILVLCKANEISNFETCFLKLFLVL